MLRLGVSKGMTAQRRPRLFVVVGTIASLKFRVVIEEEAPITVSDVVTLTSPRIVSVLLTMEAVRRR